MRKTGPGKFRVAPAGTARPGRGRMSPARMPLLHRRRRRGGSVTLSRRVISRRRGPLRRQSIATASLTLTAAKRERRGIRAAIVEGTLEARYLPDARRAWPPLLLLLALALPLSANGQEREAPYFPAPETSERERRGSAPALPERCVSFGGRLWCENRQARTIRLSRDCRECPPPPLERCVLSGGEWWCKNPESGALRHVPDCRLCR